MQAILDLNQASGESFTNEDRYILSGQDLQRPLNFDGTGHLPSTYHLQFRTGEVQETIRKAQSLPHK